MAKFRAVNVTNRENRLTISSTLNKKFNAKWNLRAGLLSERYLPDFQNEDRDDRVSIPDDNAAGIPDYFITNNSLDQGYSVHQAFAQAEHRITDYLSVTGGVHTQYHSYTEDIVLEPRAAISWQARPNQRFSLAYGLHAQAIPSPILFYEEEVAPQQFVRTNDRLDFMQSHHMVLAYDRNLGESWRLKAETYYQSLFDIPVERMPSSYSILNEGADFIFEERGNLVNEGTGTNYGIELTLEKFFSKGYYMLLTTSIYESTYEGSDGVERSTAFNNNAVFNLLFGKEWKFGEDGRNAWTFDTRFTTAGGQRFTPIDIDSTRANAGREVRFQNLAFSQQYDTYLRWDVKFGVRLNGKKRNISHQFFVDFQNVTNRKNEFVRRYNEVTDEINRVDQIGFFPDVLYRIQF